MKNKRDFDLIIWGATGFTGNLVCDYINKNYNERELRWAIAGRNKKKILKLQQKLKIDDSRTIIADSSDKDSLVKMVKKSKVVCTTVGPYAKYGTNLVEACIEGETNYCDITGETQWIRRIIDRFHTKAKEKNIKIINSCGFD